MSPMTELVSVPYTHLLSTRLYVLNFFSFSFLPRGQAQPAGSVSCHRVKVRENRPKPMTKGESADPDCRFLVHHLGSAWNILQCLPAAPRRTELQLSTLVTNWHDSTNFIDVLSFAAPPAHLPISAYGDHSQQVESLYLGLCG